MLVVFHSDYLYNIDNENLLLKAVSPWSKERIISAAAYKIFTKRSTLFLIPISVKISLNIHLLSQRYHEKKIGSNGKSFKDLNVVVLFLHSHFR